MYYFLRHVFVYIFLIIVPATVVAQSNTLDSQIQALVNKEAGKIAPGGVILLARNDSIIYYQAFGYDNIATKLEMDRQRIFRIGSITKSFTALAVLMLMEEGKIRLKDSIQQYIPDFPVKNYPVTIAHLLTNTSGIKNYFEIDNPAKAKQQYTPREGIAYFEEAPLEFEPGTRYQYSNSNYYLLGYIIEKASGMPYADFIRTRIFDAVGMPHSSYGAVSNPRQQLAKGYTRIDGKLEDARLQEISAIYAAGGLLSNAEDLLKWHKALLSGKLISRKTLKQAMTPFRLRNGERSEYGYGWFVADIDGVQTIEHSGATDGYQADLVYIPEKDIRLITLFNCYETSRNWIMFTNDLARVALGKPLEGHLHLSKEVLQQYAGIYRHDDQWKMIFTMKGDALYVRCPKAGIPDVKLYAQKENYFYIKEAPLKFELTKLPDGGMLLTTYNNSGKDAEWKREE